MCKVTKYISSHNFGNLYDIVCSQFKYFDRDIYWKDAADIRWKSAAIWERLDGAANGDRGDVGTNLICFHRHLKLSKRRSPYSIIKEIREYLTEILGSDIFKDYESFHDWEKQFYNQRFASVSHNFKNIIQQ